LISLETKGRCASLGLTAKTFRSYLPEQDLLLPPSLHDWLPGDHLAYLVSDMVDQLDLSGIESVYEEEEHRSATVSSADDDQDFDLRLLCGGGFAKDAEAVGTRQQAGQKPQEVMTES
jgi:hypothetical protein